jgi:hypothetical protein
MSDLTKSIGNELVRLRAALTRVMMGAATEIPHARQGALSDDINSINEGLDQVWYLIAMEERREEVLCESESQENMG